jgi:hypothetical protein
LVIGMAVLITVAGVPVYVVGVVWKSKPAWLVKMFGMVILFYQDF